MRPDELERVVDEALRGLPVPKAPDTLLPRVMRAVRAQRVPRAARRGWFTWSPALQTLSIASSVVLMAALVWWWPSVATFLGAWMTDTLGPAGDRWSSLVGQVEPTVTAARVILRTVVQPAATLFAAVVLVMWMASVTFGVALGRLVLGGATK